jgi:hypothetical protein
VPFTKRRHIILMPSVAESVLGAHLYETFLIEQHKKVRAVQCCCEPCHASAPILMFVSRLFMYNQCVFIFGYPFAARIGVVVDVHCRYWILS